MSAPGTREPQKIPISQATPEPHAVRFSSLFDVLKKIGVVNVEYVEDRVAVLVRSCLREQTMQRILAAEDIASPPFQDWLKEQNDAGADIFRGMNPLRAGSFARTKKSIREIRHVYLDLE